MSKTPLTPKNGNVRNFSNGGDFGLSAVKDPKRHVVHKMPPVTTSGFCTLFREKQQWILKVG